MTGKGTDRVVGNGLPVPPFRPWFCLRNGHVQTLASWYLRHIALPYRAARHEVGVSDGDRIVLHDDCPPAWRAGGRVVLMLHGLGGTYRSSYMQRIASKLSARGVRTFRMDLRGSGAGLALAKLPYHSGRSDDAAAAIRFIAETCPGSPVTLVGFSLGGNITLKLLGECGASPPGGLDSAIAVCPPIELEYTVSRLSRRLLRPYDRHFVRTMVSLVQARRGALPAVPDVPAGRVPRTLYQFDNVYTAPVCGFPNASDYYARCSSGPLVPRIEIPTVILAARDDPLVPFSPFERVAYPKAVRFVETRRGGHMGFLNGRGPDPDRQWMDWRIVEWVEAFDGGARIGRSS